MTSETAKALHRERKITLAVIERDQQKIDRQFETTQEEFMRWALLNQWKALEKIKQQIQRSPDYRKAAQSAYQSHFFPRFNPEKAEKA
ncbi:conserved protein of unknown function [Ruminococcaceae bacterium BL-6]|jgi:hypothetical protein|nr:conserved protein of unknown function [Ruminococcaceae bacterium BL-6]HBC26675.1 hypothetical protein [Oscillospiraceae bacterium]